LIKASQQGRVLHLELNRPEKRNALNTSLCRALVEAFAQADADPAIGAILLSGNGPAFCAGMDLKEAANEAGSTDLNAIHNWLFTVIDRIHKPTIAAVHGAVVGGGVGLAANAHIVIASPEARFGLTEIKIALWPVMIFRAVVLAVGERRATELSLTGRMFSAQEALSYGLVTEISDNPLARAQAVADEVSRHSAHALARGLEYSRSIRGLSWADAGELGRTSRDELMAHPDFAKAVAAFLNKEGRNPRQA
jgi:enoyl-CoA hydratase/carnithine racemase